MEESIFGFFGEATWNALQGFRFSISFSMCEVWVLFSIEVVFFTWACMMCSYFAISKIIWPIYILGVLFWVKRVVIFLVFFLLRGGYWGVFFLVVWVLSFFFPFIFFWSNIWFEDHVFFKNLLQERKKRWFFFWIN